MLTREAINHIIKERKYTSYLEIGTHRNHTFDVIECETKVGVDPSFTTTFKMTSDEFFKQNTSTFDLIFIDGDHSHKQVRKDILNSLEILNSGGCIFLHDVNPRESRLLAAQLCSDAWWAFATLRTERDDIWMCTFPFDHLGYIEIGKQEVYQNPIEKTWDFLDNNRKILMNEISWEEFLSR